MAYLTESQKIDLVFKKILGKAISSIGPVDFSKFYNEPVDSFFKTNSTNVWCDYVNIQPTDTSNNGVILKIVDLPLLTIPATEIHAFWFPYNSQIPNVYIRNYDNSQYSGTAIIGLKNLIPFNYGLPPSTYNYNYTLKNSIGTVIPFSSWYIDPESGLLTFFDSSDQISYGVPLDGSLPPLLTCYIYIGRTIPNMIIDGGMYTIELIDGGPPEFQVGTDPNISGGNPWDEEQLEYAINGGSL